MLKLLIKEITVNLELYGSIKLPNLLKNCSNLSKVFNFLFEFLRLVYKFCNIRYTDFINTTSKFLIDNFNAFASKFYVFFVNTVIREFFSGSKIDTFVETLC